MYNSGMRPLFSRKTSAFISEAAERERRQPGVAFGFGA